MEVCMEKNNNQRVTRAYFNRSTKKHVSLSRPHQVEAIDTLTSYRYCYCLQFAPSSRKFRCPESLLKMITKGLYYSCFPCTISREKKTWGSVVPQLPIRLKHTEFMFVPYALVYLVGVVITVHSNHTCWAQSISSIPVHQTSNIAAINKISWSTMFNKLLIWYLQQLAALWLHFLQSPSFETLLLLIIQILTGF